MSSDIMKQKETQERMGKEQRHKIGKSKKEMEVDHSGHLYSWTLILEATFLVSEIQHDG